MYIYSIFSLSVFCVNSHIWFTIYLLNSSIPTLLPTIQERLLDSISMVLSKSPFPQTKPGAAAVRSTVVTAPQQLACMSGAALVQLSLRTLARFNFKVVD